MSKNKKKRSKKYGGTTQQPIVTRISAVNRSFLSQWWVDHQKLARPVITILGIATAIFLIIMGIVSLF